MRNLELILNVTDDAFPRGNVGVFTDNNDGAYFDGLMTYEYDKKLGVYDRSIDT